MAKYPIIGPTNCYDFKFCEMYANKLMKNAKALYNARNYEGAANEFAIADLYETRAYYVKQKLGVK